MLNKIDEINMDELAHSAHACLCSQSIAPEGQISWVHIPDATEFFLFFSLSHLFQKLLIWSSMITTQEFARSEPGVL